MKGLPSPPTVAATLSGFVVGCVMTLIATGIITHSDSSRAATPAPLPREVSDTAFQQRAQRIVARQLGPSVNGRKTPRLLSLTVSPALDLRGEPVRSPGIQRYRTIRVLFRLYDHPLGRAWRLRSAKADVFAVLKGLYTSSLPVYDVEMIGVFPTRQGSGVKEIPMLHVYMDYQTEHTIPWQKWGRTHEGDVWNALPFRSVDPRFA